MSDLSQDEKDNQIFDLYSSMSDKEKDSVLGSLSEKEVDTTLAAIQRHKSVQAQPISSNSNGGDGLGGTLLNYGGKVLHGIGTAIDYFDAPARGAVGEFLDQSKSGHHYDASKLLHKTFDPLVDGPSKTPQWKDIYKDNDISDKQVMITPFENAHPEYGRELHAPDEDRTIEGGSLAGLLGGATELTTGGAGLGVALKGLRVGGKVIAKAVDPTEQAVKALGLKLRTLEEMLSRKGVHDIVGESVGPEKIRDLDQHANDVADYLKKKQDYYDSRKKVLGAIGQGESDINQQILPGLTDDLQETTTKSIPVELNGKDPAVLSPSDIIYSTNHNVKSMPQRPEGIFNEPHGDDLLPLNQKMALDNISRKEIQNLSTQGEMAGTELTPRTVVRGDVPAVEGIPGQTEMVFDPNPPKVPEMKFKPSKPLPEKSITPDTNQVEDAVEYARKSGILSANPLKSGTMDTLKRVHDKMNDVGVALARLRDNNTKLIDKYISENSHANYKDYLDNGFNSEKTIERINAKIDHQIEDVDWSNKVKEFVDDKLKQQFEKYGNRNPNLKQLQRLKKDWQSQVNYAKDVSDLNVSQTGYDLLQAEAKRAMDHELEFIGNAIGGNDKVLHTKLMKEYQNLSILEDGLKTKAAGTYKTEKTFDFTKPGTWLPPATKVQSALSQLPTFGKQSAPVKKNFGVQQFAPISTLRTLNNQTEQRFEGFPQSQTQQVDPATFPQEMEAINKSGLSPSAKAQRLNLLNKHGRVYLGL